MNRGFTLPELLVSIAIIVIMTGLMLPNWRSGDKSLAVNRVAHKASQDVRRAQELAMRAERFTCGQGSISGYGVFFNQDTPTFYILFAECNKDNTYNAGTDGVIETIELESTVQIAQVSPSSAMSVVFEPPAPTVFLKPSDPSLLQVVFQRTDGQGVSKSLNITNKGVLDVD